METFSDTADILDHLKHLHRQLQRRYREGGDQVEHKRVKMMLDAATGYHADIADAISRFEQRSAPELLRTQFQYTPEALAGIDFDFDAIRADMTVDEAVRLIVEPLSRLAEIYNRLAEMAAYEEVAEVFRSLEQQLRAIRNRLAQSGQQMKDM